MPKRPRMVDKMMRVTAQVPERVYRKEKDRRKEVFDVTEPRSSPELGIQIVEANEKVRKAMCSICLSTKERSENLWTAMSLQMWRSCSTKWIWISVTCHIVFEAVLKTSILAMAS